MRRKTLLLPFMLALTAANNGAPPPAGPTAIVTLEPITATIVDAGQIQGRLTVTLAVTGKEQDALEERLPVLRAATFAALAEHARLRATPYSAVDATALSADLTRSVHHAAAEADGVLLLKVEARPA